MVPFPQKLLEDAVQLMGRHYVAKSLEVPNETLDGWLCGQSTLSRMDLIKLARAAVEFSQKYLRGSP
jgi:hypothetical protein